MAEWSMVVLNIHDPKALNGFCIGDYIDKIVFKWTTTQLESLVNCCRDKYDIHHTSVGHLSVKSKFYRRYLPVCDKRRKSRDIYDIQQTASYRHTYLLPSYVAQCRDNNQPCMGQHRPSFPALVRRTYQISSFSKWYHKHQNKQMTHSLFCEMKCAFATHRHH